MFLRCRTSHQRRMSICSSDLFACILSFSSMQDQLVGSRVCSRWKHLVHFHPSLLNVLEVVNEDLEYTQLIRAQKLFKLAHLRLREFRVYGVYGSIFGSTLSRMFPNLVRLSFHGHIERGWVGSIVKSLSTCGSVDLLFIDCSCHKAVFIDMIRKNAASISTISFPSAFSKSHVRVTKGSLLLPSPQEGWRCPLCRQSTNREHRCLVCTICRQDLDSPCHPRFCLSLP